MFDISIIDKIKDEDIREGVRAAIMQNLLPACHGLAYPGHFGICADGLGFGQYSTWPGLDSWQIAGAYLLMDKVEEVLGYFDFVEASQRADGNIPFAVWLASEYEDPGKRTTFAKGLKYPEDIFEYDPGDERYQPMKWIGLFEHWVYENPLRLLGAVCYLLTAGEIFQKTKDKQWLSEKLPSIERACRYILTQKSVEGLYDGAGFYLEMPPRAEWDGITQCYCYKAFGEMSRLCRALGQEEKAEFWKQEAEELRTVFRKIYWKNGRFAEYVHSEHGAVTYHGYTDVDFAAIAFGLADEKQANELWPTLTAQKNFWWGKMPTQVVTMPFLYRDWELGHGQEFYEGSPIYDVAAIGRVWFLEMNACLAMKDYDRVVQAVKLVCQRGLKDGGCWYERYHMVHSFQEGEVSASGPRGYCEYPAIIARIVLGNMELFI